MKDEQWRLLRPGLDYKTMSRELGIQPLVLRLLANRGYRTKKDIEHFLKGGLEDLYDPYLMGDIALASDIIAEKIGEGSAIRVIGDYDIDGVMSTYILVDAIKYLGGNVDYIIPHRIKDGYGLNDDLVKDCITDGIDTIITCDNGISAFDQISMAVDSGITCIITDHHDIPFKDTDYGKEYIIPPADAVIDPKLEDCGYPFHGICGAVVAMKLIQVLFDTIGRTKEEALDMYLPMAAFATVGDVMELKDENRIIVKYGLEALKSTSNHGIKALIEACSLNKKKITAVNVGFILGPCLNAAGRLDTAVRSLELMFSPDYESALRFAAQLRSLNEERKNMTQKAVEEACSYVDDNNLFHKKVLIIYLPNIHESLAGIVAGKVRERYYRPTFILTDSNDCIKGSGRSIDSYSMYDEMNKCRELFIKFGGHPKAAGLSLKKENLQAFIDAMEDNADLSETDLKETVLIDADMPFSYATKELYEEISNLEPYGNGNRSPFFARRDIELIDSSINEKRTRGIFKVRDPEFPKIVSELYYFGDQDSLLETWAQNKRLTIGYNLMLDEFNGNENLRIVIKKYK